MSIVYPPKVTELLESNIKLTLKNDELNKRIAELELAIKVALVGCCSCLTKTPKPKYHDDRCLVKILGSALEDGKSESY